MFRLIDIQGKTHQHFNINNSFIGEHKFQLITPGMKSGLYFSVGIEANNSVDMIKITKTNLR